MQLPVGLRVACLCPATRGDYLIDWEAVSLADLIDQKGGSGAFADACGKPGSILWCRTFDDRSCKWCRPFRLR